MKNRKHLPSEFGFCSNLKQLFLGRFNASLNHFLEYRGSLANNIGLNNCAALYCSDSWLFLVLIFGLTYFFIPIFVISRLFNAVLPILIVCYLFVNDYLWNEIDWFQYIMILTYSCLVLILITMFVINVRRQSSIRYILPYNEPKLPKDVTEMEVEKVKQYYQMMVFEMQYYELFVSWRYGKDIATIILSYLPTVESILTQSIDGKDPKSA